MSLAQRLQLALKPLFCCFFLEINCTAKTKKGRHSQSFVAELDAKWIIVPTSSRKNPIAFALARMCRSLKKSDEL